MSIFPIVKASALAALAMIVFTAGGFAADSDSETPVESLPFNIQDPWLQRLHDLSYDKKPARPVPGVDYGMDGQTGVFKHPKATPMVTDPPSFEGQLDYWEDQAYAHNMEVVAFLPEIASPGHSWQNIVDWGDRRIMYLYLARNLKVIDITDPRKAKVIYSKGGDWWFGEKETNPFPPGESMGAASMQWNRELKKFIMVQSFAAPRFGVLEDKLKEPEGVEKMRHLTTSLKGFRVYEMNGPLPDQWKLIAERTTDYQHPDAVVGQQSGSGSHDVPAYYGGKYMYLSAAPDDSFGLTEFPDYLWSAGFQTWDMSDPANPTFVSQFSTIGQIIGDPAHEEAYLMNPRAGNRTSWMGSRMPPFFPQPVEEGGKVAFGAMAALGMVVLDMSDPAHMREVGAVNTAPRFAGTEFDNIDVTQPGRWKQGVVAYAFYNAGVQLFDVQDPLNPAIVAYYVPRFPTPEEMVENMFGNLAFGIYVEYDRNILWLITNHGIYALSSPALGEPVYGLPEKPWPPRD